MKFTVTDWCPSVALYHLLAPSTQLINGQDPHKTISEQAVNHSQYRNATDIVVVCVCARVCVCVCCTEWITQQGFSEGFFYYYYFSVIVYFVVSVNLLCSSGFQVVVVLLYLAVLLGLYLIPLSISSPCIMEREDLKERPAVIGHQGAPMVGPLLRQLAAGGLVVRESL